MELQIKDNFIPNVGISIVKFSDDELMIKEKFGIPNFEEKDINDEEDYTIRLSYENLELECFIHYENFVFSYTSFHLKNLIINDLELIKMTEKECVNLVQNYHLNLNKEYIIDIKQDENEKVIFFENIGLTIWFLSHNISDISIEPVW